MASTSTAPPKASTASAATRSRETSPVVIDALQLHPQVVSPLNQPDESCAPDLGRLWLEFERELRGFVRPRVESLEACEDLLQTAFFRAQHAVAKGTVPEEPRAWLYQIVRNLLVDVYRRQKLQSALISAFQTEENHLAPAGAHETEEGEASHIILQALPTFVATLSEPYRQALSLTDLKGLSLNEAAREAGVTLSSMKARVRRGRNQLLLALQRCCTFDLDGRGRPIACNPRSSKTSCECDD